jgi:hypothetical protein
MLAEGMVLAASVVATEMGDGNVGEGEGDDCGDGEDDSEEGDDRGDTDAAASTSPKEIMSFFGLYNVRCISLGDRLSASISFIIRLSNDAKSILIASFCCFPCPTDKEE